MSNDPIPISNWPKEVQDDVNRVLINAVKRVERGEIVGIAIAEVRTNGEIATSYSKSENWPALCGAVSTLNYRVAFQGEENSRSLPNEPDPA